MSEAVAIKVKYFDKEFDLMDETDSLLDHIEKQMELTKNNVAKLQNEFVEKYRGHENPNITRIANMVKSSVGRHSSSEFRQTTTSVLYIIIYAKPSEDAYTRARKLLNSCAYL